MENSGQPRSKIPPLLLEQWRLGELDARQKTQLMQEFGEDKIAREIAQLEADEAAFWKNRPMVTPQFKAQEVEKKAQTTPKNGSSVKTRLRPYLLPMMAAASVFLAVLTWNRPHESQESDLGPTRAKGDARPFMVYQEGDHGSEPLAEGQLVQNGALLQLTYKADGYRYGVIFSLDGRGTLTWHFPADAAGNQTLEEDLRVPLKKAYKLDDAPAFERFYFIRSMQPIDVDQVLRSVEAWKPSDGPAPAQLGVDPVLDQHSLMLKK